MTQITGAQDRVTRTTVIEKTIQKDSALGIAVTNNVGLILSSAAWPLALVIVAYIFKSELTTLITRIRSFKALGFEASLDAFIQAKLSPVPPDEAVDPPLHEDVVLSAPLSPVETIITSWLDVEKALDKLFPAPASNEDRKSIRARLSSLASQYPNAPTGLKDRIEELWTIRNRLIHAPSVVISEDSTRLYKENAIKAIKDMSRIS